MLRACRLRDWESSRPALSRTGRLGAQSWGAHRSASSRSGCTIAEMPLPRERRSVCCGPDLAKSPAFGAFSSERSLFARRT